MTFIVDGTNGATFPDTTVQTTALTTGSVTKAMVNTSTANGFGLCRAWANFNGNDGTVRSSFNVSSITYNATGDYTVNFTTAMANANYAMVGTAASFLPSDAVRVFSTYYNSTYTTTQCRIIVVLNSGGGNNRDIVNFAVFSS